MEFFKKTIYKDRYNKKICGVCSGIAKSLDIDATWIRLLFLGLSFFSFYTIIIYLVLEFILDFEPEN